MWNNYSDALIFVSIVTAYWLIVKTIVSIKAKSFNEGFKRGRSSVNVREIVK